MTKETDLRVDIAVLQTQLKEIIKEFEDIRTNDLHHIHLRLNDIEKKMAYWAGGLAAFMSTVQVIISYLK